MIVWEGRSEGGCAWAAWVGAANGVPEASLAGCPPPPRPASHEVVPGLPLRHICRLLERFAPDDSAPEPLPEGLLEALEAGEDESEGEAASPASGASSVGSGVGEEEEYSLAGEAELLAQGMVQPGSLAPDEGSDDELEGLGCEAAAAAAEAAVPGAPPPLPLHGAALLRELWSSAR